MSERDPRVRPVAFPVRDALPPRAVTWTAKALDKRVTKLELGGKGGQKRDDAQQTAHQHTGQGHQGPAADGSRDRAGIRDGAMDEVSMSGGAPQAPGTIPPPGIATPARGMRSLQPTEMTRGIGSEPPPRNRASELPPGFRATRASELPPPMPDIPPPPRPPSMIPPQADAIRLAMEQSREEREQFARAALEMAAARDVTLSKLEGQLLGLAVDIAEALVEEKLERDPSAHETLVKAALAALGERGRATLRASSAAYELITESLGGTDGEVDGVQVKVVLDESLTGLGCIAENEQSRADGRISERLRSVRRALQNERLRKRSESEEPTS